MQDNQLNELKTLLSHRPDIVGRESYTISAILVPLITVDGDLHLLFEKRAPHIKQGNEICFPGGHFDPEKDQDYLSTALRETHEELGLEACDITLIGQLDTLVSPRGLIVECFLGHIERSIDELRLDKGEVNEVFTVPLKWFEENPPEIYTTRVELQASYMNDGQEKILLPVEKLGLPAKYKNNRSEWFHPVVVYSYSPDIIWGLTAAVVKNSMDKVFALLKSGKGR